MTADRDAMVREKCHEAIACIQPLQFSQGPNFFTVDVEGWGLSAPTKRELNRMLWNWFATEAEELQP